MPPGRHQHDPSDKDRAQVKAMAAYGVPQDDIAQVIGIDPKTLRKHYPDELAKGSIEATAKVAEYLFRQATTNSVPAAMFWMKCRANWSEKVQVEHSGVVTQQEINWQALTREERNQLIAIYESAATRSLESGTEEG